MIHVVVFAPKLDDITSFYRAIGPYSNLSLSNSNELMVDVIDKFDLTKLFKADVVVLQRPFTPNHAQILDVAKSLNKPIIVDYDDDVLSVPATNPHSPHYHNANNKNAMQSCIHYANHITVSTKALYTKYSKLNPNVTIVPNALDANIYRYKKINWDARPNTVAWRGGESHTEDLVSVQQQLVNLTNNNPDWNFTFMGGEANYMKYVLKTQCSAKNTTLMPSRPMLDYVKTFYKVDPSIMIVPLVDDEFNRSKSSIAWLEGHSVGAVTVAPDMEEWHRPGIVNYTDAKDFEAKVQELIHSKGALKDMWTKSDAYIKDNLMLSDVNNKRLQLIKRLVNKQ